MTTLTVVVIPADLDLPIEKREIEGYDYRKGQAIVGGLIQPVDVEKLKASIWVNEEGLLQDLPLNRRATSLLHAAAPEHVGWTILVGDAYITGLPDRRGETQSIPAHLLRMLLDQD